MLVTIIVLVVIMIVGAVAAILTAGRLCSELSSARRRAHLAVESEQMAAEAIAESAEELAQITDHRDRLLEQVLELTPTPPSPWAEKERSTVVVTLTSSAAFRGLLWSIDDELMILRDAEVLTADGPAPADGEVLLERRNVDYVQVLH